MSRRTLINLVFFNLVFLAMLVWAVNNIVTVDAVERPYKISGDFAQAAGVKANAEVTYLGVHYGRVTGVERTPEGVSINMKIDRNKDIPEASIARIFRKSAIGEPYIDFIPSDDYDGDDVTFLEAGDNVPIERTRVPLEFSELLRSASAVIGSVSPVQAGSLVHELALALDGRGEALRDLTTGFDELTGSFVTKTEELDRLAENNTRLTRVLADHRLSLGSSLASLREVADALRDANGDTKALLDLGPDFLRTTADLVADQKRNLDCLLTDLAPLTRTLATDEQLAGLAQLLEQAPEAFGYTAAAVDHEADGDWVRVNLLTEPTSNPEVYVPRKTLPVVPSIPACASELRPVAVAPAGSSSAPTGGSAPTPAPSAPASPSTPTEAESPSDDDLADTGLPILVAIAALLGAAGLGLWHLRRTAAAR